MNYQQLIESMTPEIHQQLKRAIELGKWPDGRRLSAEQSALCMEAVIRYDHKFLPVDKRVGHLQRSCKSQQQVDKHQAESSLD